MTFPRFNPVLLLSIAILILALSGSAFAASTSRIIILSGTGSQVATVSKANQLSSAEAPPSQDVTAYGSANAAQCMLVYTPPANKALVVKDVSTSIFPVNTGGVIALYANSGCSDMTDIESISTVQETLNQPLGDGYVLPAKRSLYVYGFLASGAVTVSGYLIPGSAVSAASLKTYPNSDLVREFPPRLQKQWYRQHSRITK